VLLVSTANGDAKDLTPEDGDLSSWTVLTTDGESRILCARSSMILVSRGVSLINQASHPMVCFSSSMKKKSNQNLYDSGKCSRYSVCIHHFHTRTASYTGRCPPVPNKSQGQGSLYHISPRRSTCHYDHSILRFRSSFSSRRMLVSMHSHPLCFTYSPVT
jgi:hypothetical protein